MTALEETYTCGGSLVAGDPDALRIQSVVNLMIPDGIKLVEMVAPVHLLEEVKDFASSTLTINEDGSGFVRLPSDFLRLVEFRMDDWHRGVTTAITTTDPAYQRQKSPFAGIRGNAQRPVCALVRSAVRWMAPLGAIQGLKLEFYSCSSPNSSVASALYLPVPAVQKKGEVEYYCISKYCYRAVIYTIAALAAATFKDADRAAILNELAKGEMERWT